jgi:hypothetical protein
MIKVLTSKVKSLMKSNIMLIVDMFHRVKHVGAYMVSQYMEGSQQ